MNRYVLHTASDLKRHILAGIITAGPLFITWLVFSFILSVLANAGLPLVHLLAAPFPGTLLSAPWLQYILAVLLTVAVFYFVGRATSRVVGQQMFALFEASLERLPLVNKIYTSVRQALETLTTKKENGNQRVVLIDFPIRGQKSIGFLTRVVADAGTGSPIAVVLVPQAINPSSANLQLLPLDRITETDLTVEQAMSMILTGGTVCPDVIRYSARTLGGSSDGVGLEPDLSIEVEEGAAMNAALNRQSEVGRHVV